MPQRRRLSYGVNWSQGTKGKLRSRFAAIPVRARPPRLLASNRTYRVVALDRMAQSGKRRTIEPPSVGPFSDLDQCRFDLYRLRQTGRLVLPVQRLPTGAHEMGWKNTGRADVFMATRIIVRFDGYTE